MSTDKLQADRIRIYEAYEKSYEADVVNFVPGEVCAVASIPTGLDEHAMYRLVRESINQRIVEVLRRRPRTGEADASESHAGNQLIAPEDLSCPLLVERYHRADPTKDYQTLLPLNRPSRGARPALRFARADGTATFLGFYQLDHDVTVRRGPNDADSDWQARRKYLIELVGETVRLVNLAPNVRSGVAGKDLPIVAVTPNWLTISAHNGGGNGCGSPAGVPRAIAKGDTPSELSRLFKFSDPTLQDYDNRAQAIAQEHTAGVVTPPSGVVVAVLDTSPTARDIEAALATEHVAGPDKWLLRLVQQHVHVDGVLSLERAAFDHLNYLPNWNGPERDHAAYPTLDDFRMADHGLFVAGTIYHLAPDAEIHLVRVLGDHGVGDLAAIAGTLADLPGLLLKPGDGRRLIVNLSLGAELPVVEKFPARWFPHTAKAQTAGNIRAVTAILWKFRDLIHAGLLAAIDSLTEQGIIVVAAVGNDHYIPPIGPKEPRYPAAYAKVVSVAAVKADEAPADYTNLGDVPVPVILNNAATFGGNATMPGGLPGNGPAVTDDRPNAIMGIFSAPVLPLKGGPNQTGWVTWAGTSFATPIISAIAANLWADHRTGPAALDADGVIDQIRAMHAPGHGGGVPVVQVGSA